MRTGQQKMAGTAKKLMHARGKKVELAHIGRLVSIFKYVLMTGGILAIAKVRLKNNNMQDCFYFQA